ncbi:hypothetical protein PF006_g18473 [Phytophthora fragariae]|uniref:Uncharacterized protein n=1 Tax=Phytophthora fragariae TaxID=53985 RepID=A0A6A3SKW8_9STRA|nr:hypothetical protein PF006_g18473 [Phytophthora fragariae]
MPLWTLDELQEAATLLNYPISDDLIKERFEKFGGIARECLCLDPVISKKAELDLTKQMNAIFDPNELRKLLLEYETSHYLVHYAPKANRAFTGRQLASDFVEQKLQERMLTKSYEQREDLRNLISSWEGAASLRGWIFEVDEHEKLRQGNTLHGLTLPVVEHEEAYDKVWVQFCIVKREQIDVFDAERLSPSLAKCGPYHKPKAKNWASVDSFYLPKMEMSRKVTKADIAQWCNSTDKRLLLFQMTVAETHPVKASGVMNVLEKLGLLSHLELVTLVFVVPKKLLQTFRRQEIVGIPTTGTASVHSIDGIGKRTAELLEYYGLATIEKLEAELNDEVSGGELVEEKADVVARTNAEASEVLPSEPNASTTTVKMKDGHPADWARVLRAWREYIQKRQYGNQMATIDQYVCTWEK